MNKEFINNLPIITIMIPFVLAFVIGLFKDKYMNLKRAFVVLATAASLIGVILLIKPVLIDGQIITNWMGGFKPNEGMVIGIGLEVDSLSVFLGLIITVACFLSSIFSIKYMSKDNGLEKYYSLFLLLTASMIGFVFTGDLFNMYVMLEIMTFAAIALTAFRNFKDKSVEAAFKYIVTGSLGSSLILLGTTLLYSETKTLNLAQITLILQTNESISSVILVSFALMMVGYAVKAFMVPCHTWPTDAHMAAPSSISMILSGVMSKTGVYAIIRLVFMIFGFSINSAVGNLILIWGVVTMVIGVSMALLQHDFKRLLAFHSVSQIGYIITALGIAILEPSYIRTLALTGGTYHMLNHAIFKGLLFLTAGAVLYVTGTTDLDKVSGLGKKMPFTMAMFLFGAAAISGIPPFNGFASKWMIYESGFSGNFGIVSIIAVVVSALTLASFIKVGHSVFFGPLREEHEDIKEVPFSMKLPMAILALGTVIFGLFPKFVIEKLLLPVVSSINNIAGYVISGLGGNLVELSEEFVVEATKFPEYGIYNPTNFLILFVILMIGFLALILLRGNHYGDNIKQSNEVEVKKSENYRYEVFAGGEDGGKTKVLSNDLFWGMKHQFKGYFTAIQEAHTGNVNDYSLWIVMTLAVVILFAVIFI